MLRRHPVLLALVLALGSGAALAADEPEMGAADAVDQADPGATGAGRLVTSASRLDLVNLVRPSGDELAGLRARRHAQLKQGEPLEIAMPRDVGKTQLFGPQLPWQRLPDGRLAVRFDLTSTDAVAVRASLQFEWLLYVRFSLGGKPTNRLRMLLDEAEFRFQGGGETFEVAGSNMAINDVNWSPVVEGSTLAIEVVLPKWADASMLGIRIAQLSHFDTDPAASQTAIASKIGESDSCERDIVCRTSPPTNFRATADSVARMVFTKGGSSYLCTGTLLNNSNTPRKRMFWSANHCISTQSVANSLQTYWFYEATTCGGLTASSRRTTLTGGAFLRFNNTTRDTLLLELKTAPPSGAVYAGWSSAAIGSSGTAIEGIHHPAGDVKMYSLGSVNSLSSNIDGRGPFYRVVWTTGVTEGGSSGSALFTRNSSGVYQLRGGLYGGLSFCSAPSDPDYYSRLADVWTSVQPYLSP